LRKKRGWLRPLWLVCCLTLSLTGHFAWSQATEGAIQGVVVTDSGEAIEAATVYVASPSLLGVRIVLTDKTGFFDVPCLPGGGYTLTAEKPGFKTNVLETVHLRPGMTAFLRVKLAATDQEEEISLGKISLAGDMTSSRQVMSMDKALINHLPIGRDFPSLLRAAPGAFSAGQEDDKNLSFLGSAWRNSTYRLDGINVTDNLTLRPLFSPDSAVVEELEVTSAAQTLAQTPAGGTHVNIITRSGGNEVSGDLGLNFVLDPWNKDLWTLSEMTEKGVPAVAGIKNHIEPFLSLGGPIWIDRAWFFLAGRFFRQSQESIFLGPFEDVRGQIHSGYDWWRRGLSGFFKVTARPINAAQITAWVNLTNGHQPVAEEPSSDIPFLSTHLLDKDNALALHGAAHYFLNQDTVVSARASYLRRTTLSLLQEQARSAFWSDDAGDRYGPLNGADYNAETFIEQLYGEASARKLVSAWGGMRHTLSAAFSYSQTTSSIDWWRENNLLLFFDHRRPDNRFYPDQGLLAFWLCGSAPETSLVRGQTQRLGGYVSDVVTLSRRLTLNLSLRLDRVWGGFSGARKATSANPLSYYVGEAVIKPYTQATYPEQFPSGLNPWSTLSFANRDDLISWLSLSPRLGLVVNLWGEGKSLLKASYARYRDDLTPRDLLPLHPLSPTQLSFFWLDANGDGRPDSQDEFSPLSLDFRSLSDAYFAERVDEDLSAPVTEEITVGLEQFIGRSLSLSFRLISRRESNIAADVLYHPDSGKTWSDALESEGNWIPFTTTVPANGDFPAQTVTLFARSLAAPPLFRQWRNVAELERKYRALELSVDKRMAQGWQLSATLILSKTEGNASGQPEPFSAVETRVIDPNYFVNRLGRLTSDRPVLLKLQAAVELPLGFLLSAFYQYQSGMPWERRARVLPPADWCVANGAERIYYPVYLEAAGSRREEGLSFLDSRLEKDFRLGENSRACLIIDVLNVLGQKRIISGLNDADIWEPLMEGKDQPGRLILAPDYQATKALLGKRALRFTLKLSF